MTFPATAMDFLPEDLRADPAGALTVHAKRDLAQSRPLMTPAAVARYVREALPPGRYALYGAGSLTTALLEPLAARPDIIVTAIADRQAARIGCLGPHAVLPPEALPGQSFDLVLILVPFAAAKIRTDLVELGIEAAKIIDLAGLPACRAIEAEELDEFATTLAPLGEPRHIVLSTLRKPWSVIPDEELARVFPPADTLHIGFCAQDPAMASFAGGPFRTLDCAGALPLLEVALQGLRPATIYLRASPHARSEPLYGHLRALLPASKIIAELYDMGALFSRTYLFDALSYSEELYRAALLGNFAMARDAALVVNKSGGPAWDRLAADFDAPSQTYFPLASGEPRDPAPPPEENESLRVIYAGSMRAKELTDGPQATPGENFFRYFECFAASGFITVDLFNAAHRDGSLDDNFNYKPLIERYGAGDGPIRYHPARSLDLLLPAMTGYHFGFSCAHYPGDRVENVSRAAIGNRFMGYIAAGLPIVVDSYFEFMADLVARFGAGIVTRPEDMASLPDRMKAADQKAMRQGIADLRAYMAEENERIIAGLHLSPGGWAT